MADHPPSSVYATLRESPNQDRFLKCVAVCGSITKACRWSKLTRQAHYNWMELDPTYPARFKAALKRSASVLADEAVRRGHEGVRKAVRYKGRIVGYETEYSDNLLLRMMEAREPEVYSQRIKQEVTGKDGEALVGVNVLREWIKGAPLEK